MAIHYNPALGTQHVEQPAFMTHTCRRQALLLSSLWRDLEVARDHWELLCSLPWISVSILCSTSHRWPAKAAMGWVTRAVGQRCCWAIRAVSCLQVEKTIRLFLEHLAEISG